MPLATTHIVCLCPTFNCPPKLPKPQHRVNVNSIQAKSFLLCNFSCAETLSRCGGEPCIYKYFSPNFTFSLFLSRLTGCRTRTKSKWPEGGRGSFWIMRHFLRRTPASFSDNTTFPHGAPPGVHTRFDTKREGKIIKHTGWCRSGLLRMQRRASDTK